MILGFIHQKGGTGKSTLAIATAMYLSAQGRKVVIFDADSQGTAFSWGKRFGAKFNIAVEPKKVRLLSRDVRSAEETYEDIVVDLPPTVTPQTEKVIEIADVLVIPMRPTKPDLWALDRLIALIHVSDRKPTPPYFVLFNQCRQEDTCSVFEALKVRRVQAFENALPIDPVLLDIYEGQPLADHLNDYMESLMDFLYLNLAKGINLPRDVH